MGIITVSWLSDSHDWLREVWYDAELVKFKDKRTNAYLTWTRDVLNAETFDGNPMTMSLPHSSTLTELFIWLE